MKKILSILLSCVILSGFVPSTAFAEENVNNEEEIVVMANDSVFAGGSGTEEDPYQVSTPEQLNEVRNYPDKCFIQINDIDMSEATSEGGTYWNDGTGWIPIGTYKIPFSGTYDGHGFKIIGLNIYESTEFSTTYNVVGLFASLEENGIIQNVILTDGEYRISSEKSTTDVCYIGGITAYWANRSEIINCVNYNNIYVEECDATNLYIGGICAYTYASDISKCYNYGNILIDNITSRLTCGGISGDAYYSSNIQESVNYGTITATRIATFNYIGGVTGYFAWASVISKCCNDGDIYVEITDSNNNSNTHIGGISGYIQTNATVNDCYNIGDITIDGKYNRSRIGGLAGSIIGDLTRINGFYNAGIINGDGLATYITSKASYELSEKVFLNNCYSIADSPITVKTGSQKNVKTLSKDEMTVKDSFIGFDFDTVWNISPDINNGMPYLRNVYSTESPKITVEDIATYTEYAGDPAKAYTGTFTVVEDYHYPVTGVVWTVGESTSTTDFETVISGGTVITGLVIVAEDITSVPVPEAYCEF